MQRPPRASTLDAPGDEEVDGNGRSEHTVPASTATPAEPAARRRWPVVALLLGLLAIPLAVALAVLRSPRWYPLLDLAQTEMRVRDVSGGHPPLIGLPGRIGTLADQGSHPGPLSFWALWPFYELFGATSWALQVASASLHLIAAGGPAPRGWAPEPAWAGRCARPRRPPRPRARRASGLAGGAAPGRV